MIKILKTVVIRGLGVVDDYYEEYFNAKRNHYLKIGDGKKEIFKQDVISMLKGKIDSNTTIHISAHGDVDKGKHYIALSKAGPTETSEVFSWLREASNSKPLQVLLWSCFSGAAVNDIKSLSKGSILIANSPKDLTSLSVINGFSALKLINSNEKNQLITSPLQDFADNFIYHALHPTTLAIYSNGAVSEFKIHPDNNKALVNPEKVLQQHKEEFYSFYQDLYKQSTDSTNKQIGAISPYLKEAELSKTGFFSEQDTDHFMFTQFLEACVRNDIKTIKKAFFSLDSESIVRYVKKLDVIALELGVSPLHIAENESIVKLLLEHKANPDLARYDEATPLFIASQKGNEDIVRLLLEYKANPNLASNDGATPLFIASQKGNEGIVRLLLKHNANPNLAKNNGATPLFIASKNEHEGIARLLLEHKADPNLATKDGITALAAGLGHKAIVELLLKHNADPTIKFLECKIADLTNNREIKAILKSAEKAYVASKIKPIFHEPITVTDKIHNKVLDNEDVAEFKPGELVDGQFQAHNEL